MEALPVLPLLAPQFRTSTLSYDNIPNFDFRLRMKEYILLTFNADPHDYDNAFEQLAHMKFEANIPDPTPEQIVKLKKYYSQLCMMQKRFPMGAGEAMETPFAWHDGLIDMRSAQSEVTICDIEFEKASVLFNIGACHAQCAAKEDRETQESIKSAFSHLQQATLAFEQLNTFRNSDFFYPSVDLDANVISFYYKVHLAQAQECLVQKSLLENRSPILIAKLCLWIQEAYESAVKIVEDWNINIPESVQRYYLKLCQMKASIYGVIGYMSMGDHSEKEEKKMGWRLQYYNIANKYMEHLTQNSGKLRERFPELFATYSFLFDVISAKQKNAEKENDFIYHDRVPKPEDAIDTALKDGVRCIVDLKKVQLLDPEGYSQDLFGKLLPGFVQEGVKKYSSMKDEILKEMKDIVKSYDDHLNYQLELSDFDRLRFMLSSGKNREAWFEIPEDLMRRNADMTAYPDCVPNLIEKMRESSDTARVAEAKLNTLLSKLRAIDLPRLKADEGFNLIQKELERLAEHLEQAKANNGSLSKAIAQHSANLQLLTLPCVEMWQKIVPEEKEGGDSSAPSEQEKRINEMVNKVLEMIDQRKTLIAQLEASLKADDISSKMIGTNERGAEEIMYKELEKHSDAQKYIRLNATAQDAILRAFTDANADFFEERTELAQKRKQYEERVGELCASYEVYRDVEKKVEEGDQFYRQLMARCDQFAIPVHAMEEQYREEIEKKERAKKEAEHHMNQLRMSREAQNALMDFGGAGGGASPTPRAPGPPGAGYPGSGALQHGSGFPAPRAPGGPRLGDFLDSYRARKQNPAQAPPTPAGSTHMDSMEYGGGGPPSPTPSSICDFPVSSQRSQRFGPVSPNPQGYGAHHGAAAGPQYQPAPYQAPPPIPPSNYQHAASPFPLPPGAAPSSYQVPRYVPPPQAPPTSQATGYPGYAPSPAPGPQYQAPPQAAQYAPSQVSPPQQLQAPPPTATHPGYAPAQAQAPPTSQGYPGYSGYGAQGPAASPAVPPPPQQQYQHQAPPPSQGYSGYQQNPSSQALPPIASQAPHTNQGYPGYHQNPSQAPHPHQGYPGSYQAPPAPQAPPTQAPPPIAHAPPTSTGYGPVQNPPPGGAQYQAPPPETYAASYQAPPTQTPQAPQAPPSTNPAPHGYSPAFGGPHGYQAPPQAPQAPPTPQAQAPPPPQYPSYQHAPPPTQPTFQHPPQGTPILAPPPSNQQQMHQHVPNGSGAPNSGAQQQQGARFTPTAGAPSPWHATPAELKTPWNTTPQYHAPSPTPSANSGAPGAQQTQGAPPHQSKSNVDLLSDLLGDFNMTPSMQPSVQNQQHHQHQQQAPPPQQQQQQQHQAPPPPQSDFRQATLPPEPPSRPFVRPAAAVQPMPQQPPQQNPELSQIAQQQAQNYMETPILIKGSPSITELADPSKFELGQGNVQKLEKRMLHQSFRTNGPPPPLNQSDPLNQIDAFSSFSLKK